MASESGCRRARVTAGGARRGTGRWLRLGLVAAAAGWSAVAGAQEPGGEPVLTLEQCVAMALEQNPTYAQAREQVRSAEGSYGLARSAMLPSLSASSTFNRFSQERVYFNERADTLGALPSSNHSYSAGLFLRQNLFSGGRNRSDLKAADAGVDAARESERDARQATVLRAKESYLNLLRAQHLLRVAEETLQASRHRQERVEALFNVGSVARADVLQNRVQLAEDELALISQQNQVEIAQATLASVLGLAADRAPRVQDVPVDAAGALPDLAQAMEEAKRESAQLGAMRGQVAASRARHTAAKSGRYPSLDLGWNYSWGNFELPGNYDEWKANADWTANLTLSFDLFDGLATRSRIVAARHDARQAEKQYAERELAVLLDVRQQHSGVQQAAKKIRVAGESVAAAEERLRLEEERYRLGAATLLQLIEAQVDLTRARTSEVEARYDYALARARLERAVGRES